MFVGAALFPNALGALGRVDVKCAPQTVVPFYLVATANSPDDVLLVSGIFLFGFTYLYVGIATLAGVHDGHHPRFRDPARRLGPRARLVNRYCDSGHRDAAGPVRKGRVANAAVGLDPSKGIERARTRPCV